MMQEKHFVTIDCYFWIISRDNVKQYVVLEHSTCAKRDIEFILNILLQLLFTYNEPSFIL